MPIAELTPEKAFILARKLCKTLNNIESSFKHPIACMGHTKLIST